MCLEFDESGKVIIPRGLEKIKPFYSSREVVANIRGHSCIFNKKYWEIFDKEFNYKGQAYINDSGYLVRKNEKKRIESFHRLIMDKEIKEFCEKHNCSSKEIEVNHLNGNEKDNRKENLEVLMKITHKFIHREEREWKIYRKKMSEFWDKNKGENYYRKHFHHQFCLRFLKGEGGKS